MSDKIDEIKFSEEFVLSIIDDELADCEKLVAILLSLGITDTQEIANRLKKKIRTLERPYAKLRRKGYAKLRGANTQKCVLDTQECVYEYAEKRNGTDVAISRAPKELPNGNTLTKLDTPPLSPSSVENRVRLEKGVLIICDDLRTFWEPKLGGPESLDLALIQASGYVQEHSQRSLEKQLSAQLARYARDKRERDERYNSAKSKNAEPEDRSDEWAQAYAELRDLEGAVQ